MHRTRSCRILAEHRVRFEKSGDYSGIESAPSVGPASAAQSRSVNSTSRRSP